MKNKLHFIWLFLLPIFFFSQAPTNGLVAYYPFNGNAHDESGNGNNGTVNGASLTTDRFGNAGRAYIFNGTSDYIEVLDNPLLRPEKITISTWIKTNNIGRQMIVGKTDYNSSLKEQYCLWTDSQLGTQINVKLNSNCNNGNWSASITNDNISDNKWHQIIGVFDGTNLNIYIDGVLKHTTSNLPQNFIDNCIGGNLNFGRWWINDPIYFNGKLDDIRIYNRALSDAEVAQIYQAEHVPTATSTGLVAYYLFNGNAHDESGNGNHGTVNGATITTDRFGNCNSAYSFNGTSDYIEVLDNPSLSGFTEMTVSFWIKKEIFTNNREGIITKWFQNSANSTVPINQDSYGMYLFNNNFEAYTNNNPTASQSTSTNFNSNNWSHITFVDSNSLGHKIYINGILVGQNSVMGNIVSSINPVYIGADNNGGALWRFFNGKLDDIRIYNIALDQQQVTDLYNSEKPSNTGASYEPGITVLVHGFQLAGGTVDNNFDFAKMGHDILQRAGGGVMYKNNKETGQLEVLEGTYDPNKEIVLVYDWMDLSWIPDKGSGELEAAADNLFATFLKLANPTNAPMSYSLQQFLNKPKHFIAHSRGNIVTLQFLHRLKTYFPNVNVEQFTLLDPHPATTFGDLHSDDYLGSLNNLPGVEGTATGCTATVGCNTVGNDVYIKIPENVLRADDYYRTDGEYEGLGSLGAFDGLPVLGLNNFNRKLNNEVIYVGSPTLFDIPTPQGVPNAHSGVHKWYKGTINTGIDVANNVYDNYPDSIISTASQNTNNWYTIGSLNMVNDFLQNECRYSTGFAYSRIGGKYNQLPLIDPSVKATKLQMDIKLRDRYGFSAFDYPFGIPPHSVFGGNFHYNNDAGWSKNGSSGFTPIIINNYANINQSIGTSGQVRSSLKHSLMYFGGVSEHYQYIKLDAKSISNNPTGKGLIKFYNDLGNEIGSTSFDLSILDNNNWKTLYFPLPDELKAENTSDGKVGTFGIFGLDNNTSVFSVDNIELLQCSPITNDLYVSMPDPTTLNFTDIGDKHWAKEGINKSRNYGFFRGTSNTSFSPDLALTKAQAITVLVRAGIKLGIIPTYNTTGLPFADVTSCNQYFPYIQTAKNLGHLEFTSNFNPNSAITVAQLCVYMDKILHINQHDWNATSNPWVMAPTSAYIFNQMSKVVVNQSNTEQSAAMNRILNCIDVVKNDNAIDSYRTQNVWTLKDVENINISDGQIVYVDGTATVTRARMAVAIANMYRFIYKKLNNGASPTGKFLNNTNVTSNDPVIDDFIGIGNTFDNKDVPTNDDPETVNQVVFNINSGDTLGLLYQSDTDSSGNPQFFYWSMNKNVDGNLANLVSVPINSIQNHRKVNFIAPIVTTPKTWYLYSYLANNKGNMKETVITINVSANTLSTNNNTELLDDIKVYPNPTDNIVFVDSNEKRIDKIEIFDLQGRLLKTIKESKNKYQIDISNFISATYLLKITTDKESQSVKIIKK